MNRPPAALLAFALIAAAALAACSPKGGKVSIPALGQIALPHAAAPFDKDRLENAIDVSFGGPGTCVVVDDTATGAEVYRYNSHMACTRTMPPCATYDVAGALIGLDAGVVTPDTALKWDHTPQPTTAWQQDADLRTAFRQAIPWWQQRVAEMLGRTRLAQRLKDLDYGNHSTQGYPGPFWMGPSEGGGLFVSTHDQAQFLHRLYAGRLPVSAPALQAVEAVMADETRGDVAMSGAGGSCASQADNSRQVGWWIGRLKSPAHDYVFAASIESDNDNALPGTEVSHRLKTAFAQAGLWPSA